MIHYAISRGYAGSNPARRVLRDSFVNSDLRFASDPALSRSLDAVLADSEARCADVELGAVRTWKAQGGHAVGMAPAYVPAEIIEAAGALPAHLAGGGPALEAVQGDAFFQSAICHLPRSLVELGIRGALDALDLVVIPSTCDVLRNLSGIWQLMPKSRPVHFLELPQRRDAIGLSFYREQLTALTRFIEESLSTVVSSDRLRDVIVIHNERRRAIAELETLRAAEPWRVPTSELIQVIRAGATMSAADHLQLLWQYLVGVVAAERPALDVARVVVVGGFCEQPPVGFVKTLERAGCFIVADDLLLGMRWLRDPVREDGEPLTALAEAYLRSSPPAPCRFEGDERRGDLLVKTVRERRAAGVILAAPSFCDMALLDRPALLSALDAAGIPAIQLQYAENSVDYASVREQAGTFADALRLWGDA
jgi:benzoyl-CoA reductase subunit C